MVAYRRNFVQGGTYFFTVTLCDRHSSHLTNNISNLKYSFRECKRKYPFVIDAIVILPEHLHCILTLPIGDSDYSKRWRLIKSKFTQCLLHQDKAFIKDKHGQYNLWQRRFWEHTIRDEVDLNNHIDYIHFNPVKHQLVNQVKDWQFSSFHRFVEKGILQDDWGSEVNDELVSLFGERQ